MSVRTFTSLAAALIASTALAAAPAQAVTIYFDVPAQSLGQALIAFSKQAKVKIVYPAAKIRGVTAPSVRGTMTRQEALGRLIAGSGLRVVGDDGQVVALARWETCLLQRRVSRRRMPIPRSSSPAIASRSRKASSRSAKPMPSSTS
ncbi:STN domain-containing protein [Sphingomonas sanxanigenens]|nr:STN domain-containing protein [Sphingomonas sanxanigenens]